MFNGPQGPFTPGLVPSAAGRWTLLNLRAAKARTRCLCAGIPSLDASLTVRSSGYVVDLAFI
jgi:hypothetical protein